MSVRADAASPTTADDWRVVTPGAGSAQLAELSAFRGRILYANGRRPGFMAHDGSFIDEDLLDSDSLHITARAAGQLVGCIRLRPLPEHSQSLLAPILSEARLELLLRALSVDRSDCLEARGLTVEPSMRGASLGSKLMIGCWVVGRWLRKRFILGAVGTRDRQSRLMAHIGAELVPCTERVFASEFDDELQAMYIDLDHPPARLQADLDRVARLLSLPTA